VSLKENRYFLKQRYPAIYGQLKDSKKNNKSLRPILTENGNYNVHVGLNKNSAFLLYDDDDPVKVAENIIADWNYASHDIIFFVGMGIGYLPLAALIKFDKKTRIVIIEPWTQIFELSLHLIDLRLLLSCSRVDLYVGEDINIAEIVDRNKNHIPIGKNRIVIHPNYSKFYGAKINALQNELTERVRAVRDIWSTTKKYGRKMLSNAIANFPSLFAGASLKILRDKFKGVSAVCIAAGPSLDSALDELKKLQGKALLIACDSAVNVLIKAGIRPHIVVSTDIFETNLDKLKPHLDQLRETILIFGIESNPDNVRFYLGKRRIAVTAYNKLLINWIDPKLDLQCRLPAMTSVSHLALFSALALGADPIVLVGMDLAYLQGKSHAFGSVFFHSLEHTQRVSTQGNKGIQVQTSPQFVADKLLIEKAITQNPVRFINTSVDGAYIKGVQIKRLPEIRATDMDSEVAIDDVLNSIDWEPVANETCAGNIIHALVDEFEKFKAECSSFRSEISELIRRIEKQMGPENFSEISSRSGKGFIEFQKKYHVVIALIKEFMLADFEEILRKEETLAAELDDGRTTQCLDELGVMIEKFDIYEKGADLLQRSLSRGKNYFVRLQELIGDYAGLEREWENHFKLACWFDENGELWQTEREYNRCIEIATENIVAYTELVQAYIKAELWHAACELVEKAEHLFGSLPEIAKLKEQIECGINGIMDKIKEAWVQGNMHTTRKLLGEYLILCSDNPQANELKDVLNELNQELSIDWNSQERKKKKEQPLQQRMEPASQSLVNMQFERAIGILEGIIDDFPGISFDIREKIGDCRMLQGDYKSALWNYTKVSRGKSKNNEIVKKMADAKQRSIKVNE